MNETSDVRQARDDIRTLLKSDAFADMTPINRLDALIALIPDAIYNGTDCSRCIVGFPVECLTRDEQRAVLDTFEARKLVEPGFIYGFAAILAELTGLDFIALRETFRATVGDVYVTSKENARELALMLAEHPETDVRDWTRQHIERLTASFDDHRKATAFAYYGAGRTS